MECYPHIQACLVCKLPIDDAESLERSRYSLDLMTSAPLVRNLAEFLRDTPVQDLGFEPMDPEKLFTAATGFKALFAELHAGIHDPTAKVPDLEEAQAAASFAVVTAMTWSIVNPVHYFEYWRLVTEKGFLPPDAVVEQLQG